MTCIAIRGNIVAADSRVTVESEAGGIRHYNHCAKLFRVVPRVDHPDFPWHVAAPTIIATAGESAPGLVFCDWYKTSKRPIPSELVDGEADFTCLVWNEHGLYEYDKYCRGEKITERFYAIGSGAKVALGAMHAGANALEAVKIACKIDPLCGGAVRWMKLK